MKQMVSCSVVLLSIFFVSAFSCLAVAGDTSEGNRRQAVAQRVQWTGDLDVMEKKHAIRFLVPYNKTFYFLDKGRQKGLTFDTVTLFEKELNKDRKKGQLPLKVVIVPTGRDQLFESLAQGYGDVAAGNLTITPERLKMVDFAAPFAMQAEEVVVTGPDIAPIQTWEELAGKTVYARKSSSYYTHLQELNAKLTAGGKKKITIQPADELLEDEDVLEMVSAGVVPVTVVDKHKADLWKQVLPDLTLGASVHQGGMIAWAIRKDSPKLRKAINAFVAQNRKGSLHFNMLFKRYLQNTKYLKNNISESDLERFRRLVDLFKQYGRKYSFDWLLIAAQAYQESGLDQSKKSAAGAIGIMQVLPSTAADPNVNVSQIEVLENNIHAGTKYLRFMVDRYFDTEEVNRLNRHLFAFAAYNAGPARVAKLRKEARESGLDPNVWFNNVEIIAAKRIGRETVQYVSNIYKYYISYTLVSDKLEKKLANE